MGRNSWTDDKLFFRLLNNKSDRTYWDNVRELRRRPTEHVYYRCIELTRSDNKNARIAGINVLAQLGVTPRPFYTPSVGRFFELLNTEKEPEVLMSLLYAIGHNNERLSKIQVHQLCELGDTDNNLIKEGLVSALLGIDNVRAIDTLINLSSDPLSHIRDWATFGLGSQVTRDNKKIRAALWKRVDDKHKDTRTEAIVGLALRNDLRIKEAIMRELLSEDYGALLFEAIIAIDCKECLPILLRHLKMERARNEADPEWIESIKNCVAELRKVPKRKT